MNAIPNNPEDRRVFERHAIPLNVRISDGERFRLGYLGDISASGAFVSFKSYVEENTVGLDDGQFVEIDIQGLPTVGAAVVRSAAGVVAVRLDITEDERAWLAARLHAWDPAGSLPM